MTKLARGCSGRKSKCKAEKDPTIIFFTFVKRTWEEVEELRTTNSESRVENKVSSLYETPIFMSICIFVNAVIEIELGRLIHTSEFN